MDLNLSITNLQIEFHPNGSFSTATHTAAALDLTRDDDIAFVYRAQKTNLQIDVRHHAVTKGRRMNCNIYGANSIHFQEQVSSLSPFRVHVSVKQKDSLKYLLHSVIGQNSFFITVSRPPANRWQLVVGP